MERMEEHFTLLKPVKNDRFITTIIDPPMKGDRTSLDYYKAQLKAKVLDALRDSFGVDTSDDALRAAIEKHNRLCRVITEIGDLRKAENPVITGYEYHVIVLVSQVCPHDLILPYLEETLAELKTRRPEAEFPFRARVVLAGSEIDDPEFTKLLESCGAMVVADRYCFGTFPGRRRSRSTAARRPSTRYVGTICTTTSASGLWTAPRSTSGTVSCAVWRRTTAPTGSSTRA